MLVSCYDKEGKEHKKETVDARECCENLGWTMDKPIAAPAAPNVTFPAITNGDKRKPVSEVGLTEKSVEAAKAEEKSKADLAAKEAEAKVKAGWGQPPSA